MAAPVMNTVLRSILTADLEMPAAEVITKARAQGVKQPDAIIKHNIYNLRSSMRKDTGTPAPTQKAAARATTPKPATPAKPSVTPPATVAPSVELKDVFANVALVNKVVAVSGGVDQARQVVDAVRACGGVESFLQHLELVASVRAGDSLA